MTLLSARARQLTHTRTATWYSVTVLYFALATSYFVDASIWSRDITASPCPLSLAAIIAAVKRSRGRGARSGDCERAVCLPGCQCAAKPLPPYEGTQDTGPPAYSGGPVPGVRVPSHAELNRVFIIGLGECQREAQ